MRSGDPVLAGVKATTSERFSKLFGGLLAGHSIGGTGTLPGFFRGVQITNERSPHFEQYKRMLFGKSRIHSAR